MKLITVFTANTIDWARERNRCGTSSLVTKIINMKNVISIENKKSKTLLVNFLLQKKLTFCKKNNVYFSMCKTVLNNQSILKKAIGPSAAP